MKNVLHIGKFYPPVPGGMERVVETVCAVSKGLVESRVLVMNTSAETVEEARDGLQVTRVGTIGSAGSVAIAPGSTALTRMLAGPSSCASVRVSPTIAALAAT